MHLLPISSVTLKLGLWINYTLCQVIPRARGHGELFIVSVELLDPSGQRELLMRVQARRFSLQNTPTYTKAGALAFVLPLKLALFPPSLVDVKGCESSSPQWEALLRHCNYRSLPHRPEGLFSRTLLSFLFSSNHLIPRVWWMWRSLILEGNKKKKKKMVSWIETSHVIKKS